MAMIIQIAMAMINNGDYDNNHGSDNDDNNDDGVIEAMYASIQYYSKNTTEW